MNNAAGRPFCICRATPATSCNEIRQAPVFSPKKHHPIGCGELRRMTGRERPRGAVAHWKVAEDSRVKAMNFLRATGVASVPGEAFFQGGRGENLLRFCFAKKDDELARACERIAAFQRQAIGV
jgi:aminotransferase